MPDNSAALAEFARQRHDAATDRTVSALQQLESRGAAVTYPAVAAAAKVSRSWLYTQPAIRVAIDALRGQGRPTRDNVPARQQASDASLHRRLEAAHLRNRTLDLEVATLRQQLAAAHGELRALRASSPVRAEVVDVHTTTAGAGAIRR